MIELLLFWLLLPVATATGWLTAKYSLRSKSVSSGFNLTPEYFKGLNHLLNEEPDQAIDVFIKFIDVDNETVETHLALGGLFRRRGEVNRAIRIHQNLIARTTLLPSQRRLALLELAQDYHRAGLLDRAENLFLELITTEEHRTYAYRQLLDIYQQEHDWDKAIQIAQQLLNVTQEPIHTVIAHYYCEQAEMFRTRRQSTEALIAIQQALVTDPHCVRASLLEGQLALEAGHQHQAIRAFKRVEQQEPVYLAEIIEPLQICYQQLGQWEEFTIYLHHILAHYGEITPMLMLAKIIKHEQGEALAVDFIVKQLHQRPSLRGLDYLLDLALANVGSITREHLLLLKDIITQLLKNKPFYKCQQCGFMGKNLHWQCPSCKQWNTTKPIPELDGE